MSEPLQPRTEPSLFRDMAPEPERPKAPTLGGILEGLFTEPAVLFRRLREGGAPVWLWPTLLVMASAVLMTAVWGLRVDVDAMLRPILERNPNLSADQIDQAISMQGRFLLPFGILGSILGTAIALPLMGAIYWGLGSAFSDAPKPTFLDGVNMAAVLSLVMLPHQLMVALMCFLRPVGGLSPDKLSPTSLGFYLVPESPKLYALFCTLDLFIVGSWVLTFLAARHLLRVRPLGAVLTAAVPVLFASLRILFAR